MSAAPPGDHPNVVAVGVDLGGTGTRVVSVDRDGAIHRQVSTHTVTTAVPADPVSGLLEIITAVAGGSTVESVGIGASGPVDTGGMIRNRDTLAAFSDIPLAGMVAESLGVACIIDNDAASAAIGEHTYGAGSGSDALLMVTLGTGVGVGMVAHGGLVRAGDGSHPEAGHIEINGPPAPCYCGLRTCWEQLASRSALDRLTGGHTVESAQLARARMPADAALFDQFGEQVGSGLATLITLFKPDRVVLGGGASRYLDLFHAGMHQRLARTGHYASTPLIRVAELGNLAGAVGAAVLGRRSLVVDQQLR